PHILHRRHHRHKPTRSRWGPDLLPPSPPFNIYKSLLRHPNLFFQFAIRLPYPTIIDLYAIDKEFHYRFNKYSVSIIHDYARYHAPLASFVFSWSLHPELCISDPMLRPMDGRSWLARDVPGFRWVGMVLEREGVVREVLSLLGVEGHWVPGWVEGVMCKYWALMETSSLEGREAFVRDVGVWEDRDLVGFQLLLVKLDMRFSDPREGNGGCALAHMLLTQKSLRVLWAFLKGRLEIDYDNMGEMVMECYHNGEDLDIDAHLMLDDVVTFNLRPESWGVMTREGWDRNGKRMESAVNMLIKEGIRRGLNVQQYYLDFVRYGYVDEAGTNIPLARQWWVNGEKVSARGSWPGAEERNKIITDLNKRLLGVEPQQDVQEEDAQEGDAMDLSA
ncbi:hypothetical protein GQ44DRAFT_800889, partial [Phaeosphaeriaceae sp. PMI808]